MAGKLSPEDGESLTMLRRRLTQAAKTAGQAIEVRRTPGVRIFANRIGYQEVTTPFLHFDGRGYFHVEVRLAADAVLLAPLEVLARSEVRRSPVLANFDHRVNRGFGTYFTRDDIERIQPGLVTDLLSRVPGVHLEGGRSGLRRTV
jgi:hypothetical protein